MKYPKKYRYNMQNIMNLNPPVNNRSDKELFNMVSNLKKWTQQARDEAFAELLARNYSEFDITQRVKKNQTTISNYEAKMEDEREHNKTKNYELIDALLLLLFFPITAIIPGNLLAPYWYLNKYNYKRKIRQRIVLSIMSIIIWILIAQQIF